MKRVLSKHVGYVVAINATDPSKLEPCGLKTADEDFFSVVTQKDLLVHIPYNRILSAVESNEGAGVNVGAGFSKKAYKLVIHIEHMIIYKGSTGFGFQVPLD